MRSAYYREVHAQADGFIEDKALFCPYYVPPRGQLGYDWGVIVNPESPRFGLLTFEHHSCRCANHAGESGDQTGASWIKAGG